jgi:hypothetical protein
MNPYLTFYCIFLNLPQNHEPLPYLLLYFPQNHEPLPYLLLYFPQFTPKPWTPTLVSADPIVKNKKLYCFSGRSIRAHISTRQIYKGY